MYTTLRVENKTKEKLDKLKEYKRESYDEILNRIIEYMPQVKEPLIEELLKDAKKHDKKNSKKTYTTIEELKKEIEAD